MPVYLACQLMGRTRDCCEGSLVDFPRDAGRLTASYMSRGHRKHNRLRTVRCLPAGTSSRDDRRAILSNCETGIGNPPPNSPWPSRIIIRVRGCRGYKEGDFDFTTYARLTATRGVSKITEINF